MTAEQAGTAVALAVHARHVPAAQRQAFAEAARRGLGGGSLVFETCHRVEAYAVDLDGATAIAAIPLPTGGRTLTGDEAVRHLVTVAVGRDSVVVGEDQILHQLRLAVDAARDGGGLDPTLERMFALALHAGRRARSWRQGPERSLADVAVGSVEGLAGPLQGREILVVGAGLMGRLAARAAARAGAAVAVANRSDHAARALAVATHGRVVPFDPGDGAGPFAGVVVALGGPWSIEPATIEALVASDAVVVDMSVPPAVPRQLADGLGPRLLTADWLARLDAPGEPDGRAARRLDALIEETVAEFRDWQQAHAARLAASALRQRADRAREDELAALWRRLPELEPEARDAIEGMTRHLADRLLRTPFERLGQDADGRAERAVRDLFAL